MTAQETERVDAPGNGVVDARIASSKSADKAYGRRLRRQELARGSRLTRTGSPITAALTRVPFVALVLLLLSGGVVGVLYLNTISDAAGLRASQSRLAQIDLDTRIEAANKTISAMKDPAHLAAEAKALGLVPPVDAARMQIGADGAVTVIGTPTAVPSPAPAAGPTAAPAAQATVVVTAPAVPPAKVPAAKVTPAKVPAAKVTAPSTTPPNLAAPKTAVQKPAKTVARQAPVVKVTAPKTATTTTGARR